MTTINRRALVTGAVALVPAPALSAPAIHPDAELLDIGEQIKNRLPDYYKARQISHELYEQTEYATGRSCPGGELSESERWEWASNESGYSDAFERANELYWPICELAKRASKLPLRTPEGTPVKAMATLVDMDCIDIVDAIPDASAWAFRDRAARRFRSPALDEERTAHGIAAIKQKLCLITANQRQEDLPHQLRYRTWYVPMASRAIRQDGLLTNSETTGQS
jgi:hypothetical protein